MFIDINKINKDGHFSNNLQRTVTVLDVSSLRQNYSTQHFVSEQMHVFMKSLKASKQEVDISQLHLSIY